MIKLFISRCNTLVCCLALLFSTNVVQAESAQAKGLEISKERKARDLGWADSVADVSMILRNSQGQEVERKMRIKSLEIIDDGDKGLTIFDQPLDVKGTVFLNFSHAIEPDDQWIYLPKRSKVTRIRSKNKSGPFMGSEFAYEDMSSFELEKFKFTYLRDEKFEGQPSYVVEQIPLDKNSGYTKQIVWVDKKHYRVLQVESYDRKGSLLKVLLMNDYALYLDKYWRPLSMEMFNEQNGKSTELLTHEIKFKVGLENNDFDEARLKNVK